MPIGNSTAADSPASGYFFRYGKEGKAVRKALAAGLSCQRKPSSRAEIRRDDLGVMRAYLRLAAVVNAGLISFGTLFILSSAFCTSGRITTYLLISACARA